MSWFPVDDAFHSHPKARKAGLEAIGLWTVSGAYCMAYLTDGFVPEWFVKEKPKGLALARRLVDARLWTCGKNDDEQGFWFHDWKKECTKEHVLDVREKARQRKAKSRESHGESRVTDGDVPSTTQPNPTQPTNTTTANAVVEARNRGTRLPADWLPSQKLVDGMRAECPTVDLKAEHRKFVDYWTDKTGKDAVKRSWDGTWRNWMRRASERPAANRGPRATSDERFAQAQALKLVVPDDRMELE